MSMKRIGGTDAIVFLAQQRSPEKFREGPDRWNHRVIGLGTPLRGNWRIRLGLTNSDRGTSVTAIAESAVSASQMVPIFFRARESSLG